MIAFALLTVSIVFAVTEFGHLWLVRSWLSRVPIVRSVISCHYCCGFWAGFGLDVLIGSDELLIHVLQGLMSAVVASVCVPIILLVHQALLERVPPSSH